MGSTALGGIDSVPTPLRSSAASTCSRRPWGATSTIGIGGTNAEAGSGAVGGRAAALRIAAASASNSVRCAIAVSIGLTKGYSPSGEAAVLVVFVGHCTAPPAAATAACASRI